MGCEERIERLRILVQQPSSVDECIVTSVFASNNSLVEATVSSISWNESYENELNFGDWL